MIIQELEKKNKNQSYWHSFSVYYASPYNREMPSFYVQIVCGFQFSLQAQCRWKWIRNHVICSNQRFLVFSCSTNQSNSTSISISISIFISFSKATIPTETLTQKSHRANQHLQSSSAVQATHFISRRWLAWLGSIINLCISTFSW